VFRFVCNACAAFAIPVFAFTSGFGQKNLKDTAFFQKMVSLYIGCNLLYLPYYLWMKMGHMHEYPNLLFMALGPTAGIQWYIAALVFWRIATPYTVKLHYPLLICTVLSVAVYSIINEFFPNSSLESQLIYPNIRHAIRAYPFYLLGVLVSREQILRLRYSRVKYVLIAPALLSLYLCGSEIIFYEPVTHVALQCGSYLAASFFCSATLVAFIPGSSYKLISIFGQRSLSIYIYHVIFLLVATKIITPLHLGAHDALTLVVSLVLAFLICFLAARNELTRFLFRISQWVDDLLFTKAKKI
jgi:peptidoglycan/LPS O-acetylase OafA/YrhL